MGPFLHGYRSAWLPASLLQPEQQPHLADALFASTRHWAMSLHFNKGLAGAPAEDVVAAQDTAMHPAVLDAFALAICAGNGPPAFPHIPDHAPDLHVARRNANAISKAMDAMLQVVPRPAWQQAFWGPNYPRLAAVKRHYDPAGLFFVHHGVGSEAWSADGFTRLTGR